MKTMLLLFATLIGLALGSPLSDPLSAPLSDPLLSNLCEYTCSDRPHTGGGCEVRYIGPPRGGNTKGSCFGWAAGGGCSGTPRECQDCNKVTSCPESSPEEQRCDQKCFESSEEADAYFKEHTLSSEEADAYFKEHTLRSQPGRRTKRSGVCRDICYSAHVPENPRSFGSQIGKSCRCNGEINSKGEGECKTRFNGRPFCYTEQGVCNDEVKSVQRQGLSWSHQACESNAISHNHNHNQPTGNRGIKLSQRSSSSSLVKQVPDGTCVTTCDNWPHAQCKVELQRRHGFASATCINPYTGATNWFNNQPQIFSNYPGCGTIPKGCTRCDETCSLRDGKNYEFDY